MPNVPEEGSGSRPRYAPNWNKWRSFAEVTLSQAVALSCDLNPDPVAWVARMRLGRASEDLTARELWSQPPFELYQAQIPQGLLHKFEERLDIAASHVRAGKLETTFGSLEGSLELGALARWAKGLPIPWDLPPEFPEVGAVPEETSPATVEGEGMSKSPQVTQGHENITVTLPHVTRTLEVLFRLMREHWSTFDPRNPPKSTVIASEIDDALGWKAQGNGEPSRGAQTLAAAIRRDEIGDADPRSQKR